MSKRKLKINKDFVDYKAESIIAIECQEDGTPIDSFWRRRLHDAERDNCVEWIKEIKPSSTTVQTKRNTGDKS